VTGKLETLFECNCCMREEDIQPIYSSINNLENICDKSCKNILYIV